jgi:hypothetical protein
MPSVWPGFFGEGALASRRLGSLRLLQGIPFCLASTAGSRKRPYYKAALRES